MFVTVLLPNIRIYIFFIILFYFLPFPHEVTQMHRKKVWILLAGDYSPAPIAPDKEDFVIAVDGGIAYAETCAWTVDLWIGDFDSSEINAKRSAIVRSTFPSDKSQTDFELALAYADKHFPNSVLYILGSGGDEADHEFANLWVLPQIAAPAILWRNNATIVKAQGKVSIQWQGSVGDKVSLFAFDTLQALSYRGLRWTVENATAEAHIAAFARNEMQAETAGMSWNSGTALVFLAPLSLPEISDDCAESEQKSQTR